MKPLLRVDLAVVALGAAMVVALGVIAYAVLVLRPGDSQTALVLATPTAAPGGDIGAGIPAGPTPVPWVNSTEGPTRSPSPTPLKSLHDNVPPCKAAELAGAFQGEAAATAMRFFYLAFANVSSGECRLHGSPQMSFLDLNGETIDWQWLHCADFNGVVCHDTDTVLPPGIPTPSQGSRPTYGQAKLELLHDRCDYPVPQCHCISGTVAIAIDLPDEGGRIVLDETPHLSVCSAISVGMFEASVTPTPVPGSLPELTANLRLPDTVAAGATLDYAVELTNTSSVAPWLFGDPCPNYNAFFGDHVGPGFRSLNCLPVDSIGPGQTVSFDMRLQVPASTVPGQYPFYWTYFDGQVAFPAGGFIKTAKSNYAIIIVAATS